MNPLQQYVKNAVNRVKWMAMNMIARGVIQLVTEGGQTQVLQIKVSADETHDGVERFQPYGLSSHPVAGTETIVLFIGGNRDHPIALDLRGDASRATAVANSQAEAGDVVLYSNGEQFMRMGSNGKIYIDSPDNIHIHSRGVLRLEGDLGVEVYSPVYLKKDCGGRGYTYTPIVTDSYELGSLPDVPHNITPPEHPPAPSEIPLY